MSNNKILLISPDYPPPYVGGSLVYINNLVENSSLSYTILTDRNQRKNSQRIQYIESRHIVNSSSSSPISLLKMYAFLFIYLWKIAQYKLVILNISAVGNGFFAFLLKLLDKKVMVIAYAEEITIAQRTVKLKGLIKKFLIKGYRKASITISVCNFTKNILKNELLVESPIYVIPTPLHDSKSGVVKNKSIDQRSGLLSVGRLIKRKGFLYLLDAFNIVIQEIPDTHLTIIGDGPDYDLIIDYIKEKSLTKSVHIRRNISDKLLYENYGSHKLFILANLMLENGDCEGAPNVLIEAASYGLPSVAGIEGGTSDVVENEKTGFLLDPKDTTLMAEKIIMLLKDPQRLKVMSENSIIKVDKYHNKVNAGRLFAKYILEHLNH